VQHAERVAAHHRSLGVACGGAGALGVQSEEGVQVWLQVVGAGQDVVEQLDG
jgi:hypothetical protein